MSKDNIFEYFFQKYNRLEEENVIKHIRNLFRQEKETKVIKDRILRNIKNLSKHEKEEENYYKPVRVSYFRSNNYIEYKSNSDKNEALKNILMKLVRI